MEAIRKRIEVDPYEAVFGKRFEPFWSPLFPQWMKEEMGFSKKDPEKSAEPVDANAQREKSTPTTPSNKKPATPRPIPVEQPASKKAEPYAYTSSTSWDSQSNKTKRSEWDSVSRKKTDYEYDPVSNRMVPVESRQKAIRQQEETNVPARVTWKPIVAKPRSGWEQTQHTNDMNTVPRKAVHSNHSDLTAAQLQSGGLDALTAVELRASMGKPRHHEDAQEVVAEDWVSEQRALKKQIRDWDNSVTKLKGEVSAIVDEVSATQLGHHLPTTLDQRAHTLTPVEKFTPLQPAVQRLQPKEAQSEPVDLDDAAAHESTEPIVKPASVPKDWYEQADILQSDRIRRTTSSRPSPTMRWLSDMNARKAEYLKKKAVADAEYSAQTASATAKLEKANAMLQAEVASQKLAMSEHQDRASQKIKSLRGELETAYKQSSVHADAFRDQIAGLDKELTAAKSTANEVQVKAIKERYSKKVASLQKELERAYVQSSVHADEFTKQIKDLEAELICLTKAAGDASNAKPAVKDSKLREMQGEGDFCPNVVKFADSDMWYKQPSSSAQPSIDKAEQKAREKALVSEVRSIYETVYGAIDAQHRQPRNFQNAVLEKALAKHDKHAKYAFKDDGLESELTRKVMTAAGDVIKHEKDTYAYKKDDLEAELRQQVAEKKADKEYAYKKDGLEAELKQQLTEDKAAKEYAYRDGGLESTLQDQAKLGTSAQPGERFVQDGLEAELANQGKAASVTVPSERFVADNLEVELKKQDLVALPSEQSGRFKSDGLEAELKRLANEQPEFASDQYAAEAAKPDKVGKMEETMASSLGAELHMPTQSAKSATVTSLGVLWQQPPLYKVVAYDSGNDRFSTATTTSWDPAVQDTPITIPQALSQLYQPARWMQHFASLQRDGYQVVHAREDVLVLKKVQDAGKVAETKPSPKAAKPFESQNAINPVDGTRSSNTVRPVTGDYANPTGYVNLDLVQELATRSRTFDHPNSAAALDNADLDTESQDSPRIKRQEAVFSGSQRVRNGRGRARREAERERQQSYQPRERKPRSLILWMLGVGAATSGVMYVTGSVAEKARLARLEKESRSLEAEKVGAGRWRLDEGEWREGR